MLNPNLESIILETQYFPCLTYFGAIVRHEYLFIESNENFQKQTLRNRCNILNSQGVQRLIVPITHPDSKLIKDCKIDYSQNWQVNHIRSIQTAYGKSAFFEYFFGDFEMIINKNHTFLLDLNSEIMSKCLKIIKIDKPIFFTKEFTPIGSNGINVKRNIYNDTQPKALENNQSKYYQSFGNIFVNNLSILDLIMNEGTNSKKILYEQY